MTPEKILNKTAGAVWLLLLFFLVACSPALAGFSDMFAVSDDIGAMKLPRFGMSRILVLNASGSRGGESAPLYGGFFSNDLDSDTFRSYWYINSVARYDTRVYEIDADTQLNRPGECEPGGDCREWREFVEAALLELSGSGMLDLRRFDVNGLGNMPDGWLDGVIVVTGGVEGVIPVVADEQAAAVAGDLRLGAFLVAGAGAGREEILRGFAVLLGFKELEGTDGRGGIALSLMGKSAGRMPMLDAYSRLRAGWANPVVVDDRPSEIFLVPARTSGEVYVIGGDKEYFLLENRGAAMGMDEDLGPAGVAIYRVFDTALKKWALEGKPGDGFDVWSPPVMNFWPDGSYPVQAGKYFRPEKGLFRDGDSLVPDYGFQNPLSDDDHPLNSNYLDGEPSDIAIWEIDTRTHYPLISVNIGKD